MPDANGDGGMTFQFSIEGGTNGMAYDVFATTNLWFGNITNGVWTWLGQGTNCGTYAITNQSPNQQFYVLGGTLAPDGSGLTVAYENLISHGAWSDGYGTPLAWYIWQGLNPQTPGIGVARPGAGRLGELAEILVWRQPAGLGGICGVGRRAKRHEWNSIKKPKAKHEKDNLEMAVPPEFAAGTPGPSRSVCHGGLHLRPL